MATEPAPGRYRHMRSGRLYELLVIAHVKSNPNQRVAVYASLETQRFWVRPIEEFAIKFTPVTGNTVRGIHVD